MEIHDSQLDEDFADKLNYNVDEAGEDPVELIDQSIHCRDNRSGQILEYVVVDYIYSLVGGSYFVLEDGQGRRHNVTPEELHESCVD